MNSETGQVVTRTEVEEMLKTLSAELRRVEQPKWRTFEIGEELIIKGIKFEVHDLGDKRLVLKFKKE